MLILLLLTIPPSIADAKTLKENYPICLTEELLDQFVRAFNTKDKRAIEYLSDNGCASTKSGVEFSLLDRTWNGKAKIRAYTKSGAIEAWTFIEALQK